MSLELKKKKKIGNISWSLLGACQMSCAGPEPCELSMPHCTPCCATVWQSRGLPTACKGTFIPTYIDVQSHKRERQRAKCLTDCLTCFWQLAAVGMCDFFLFKIGQNIPKTFAMLSWPVRAWEGNTNQWIIFVYLRTLTQLVIPLGNILNFCQCLYWYRASAEIIEGSLCVKLALCNSAWERGKGPGSCFGDVSPKVRYKT